MKEDNQPEYISLKCATDLCGYSQEYLSLRARQGKLRAVKIGRNWVTTKEWVKEYAEHNGNNDVIFNKEPDIVMKEAEKEESIPVKIISEKNLITQNNFEASDTSFVFTSQFSMKEMLPPSNLPTAEFDVFDLSVPIIKKEKKVRPVFVFSLVLILLIFGAVFTKDNFIGARNNIYSLSGEKITTKFSNFSLATASAVSYFKETGGLLAMGFRAEFVSVAEKSGSAAKEINKNSDELLLQTGKGLVVLEETLNIGLEKTIILTGEFFVTADNIVNNYIDKTINNFTKNLTR